MQKLSILIGYAKTDPSGNPLGAAKVISGPPANDAEAREQGQIFSDAKTRHKFPKGIRHLVLGTLLIGDRAAYISEDVASNIQGQEQTRLSDLEAQEKKAAARRKLQDALKTAAEDLSKAAVAHNNASAATVRAKHLLLEAEGFHKRTNTEASKTNVETEKGKHEEALAAEVAAKTELDNAKKDLAKLKNPQP